MADLIAAAKAKGGELTYGTWGIGSVGHVGTAMFEAATGTRMSHVPFKDLPQLYIAVGNGEVAWAFGTAGTAASMFRANKVRFLALAARKRLAAFPDIPTVSEAEGPADFEVKGWVALFAPRATPKPVVERINAEVATALFESDVRERLSIFGFEPSRGAPREVAKAIEVDSREFAEIVKRVKISLD